MAQTQKGFWRNTQYFLLTLGNPNAQLILSLKEDLEDIQTITDYQLTALHKADLRSLKDLRRAVLNDAKGLKATGRADLSLKVIETARHHGITSAQLESGRAKALAALNQHEKALQIWHEQTSSNKLKIKEQANTEIRIYEQQRRTAVELLQSIQAALHSEQVEIKHIPETAPQQITDLERPVLTEAIELRNGNNEQLSLKLLETCNQYGLQSDLIDDNRARALFKMNHKRDAILIWQSLLSSDHEEIRESAQKLLTQLSQDLLRSIKAIISKTQQSTCHLPENIPQDLSKLGFLILKEAIELRKEKQEDLSLQILELTTSAGFETDAINENRARALINLKRNTEAVELLQELVSSKNRETQQSAKRILQTLGESLLQRMKKVLSQESWEIRHLPEIAPPNFAKLEPALLKEAIALRKEKREQLSLSILDLTIKSGFQTEKIDDNRARALVNNNQYAEAVTIWNLLKDSKNSQIQQSAISMLKRFGDKGLQQKILNEVDVVLTQEKDRGRAVNLLTDAILQSPSDPILHQKLREVAVITKNKKWQSYQEFEELIDHSQSLAGFEAFVTTLEQRYQLSLKGADETQPS
tara:strand:+ start:976 stop:2736 length:1761 start_codon:yes stop_codon:yes gene_type:complete